MGLFDILRIPGAVLKDVADVGNENSYNTSHTADVFEDVFEDIFDI